MKYLIAFLLLCHFINPLMSQDSPRSDFRIVDTLSAQERSARQLVILRSELDSLISSEIRTLPVTKEVKSETEKLVENDLATWFYVFAGLALAGLLVLLYMVLSKQKQFQRTIYTLQKQIQHMELAAHASDSVNGEHGKTKARQSVQALEKKLDALTGDLIKARKEKEELEDQLEEANRARSEFEAVKQQMMETYKIRNYPGFSKEKTETEIVLSMLETERSVANYAYEHFLKPVMAIADANKNSPSKMDAGEREKLMDLLISLALMYSEYLYLRIGDLSVGGKIVERLAGLRNGTEVDPATLRELNTEHGSRALVIRMMLDLNAIQRLSYPVFDETNLNLS